MPVPISDRLFLDYLQCKHKAFLKLSGGNGVKCDFEKFQDENHAEYCQQARERLLITGGSTTISTVNSSFKEIKRFAFLRKIIGGSSTAKGIQEYLVLLSICETLRLRNASFFRFLLSGETDIDKFLERKASRPA